MSSSTTIWPLERRRDEQYDDDHDDERYWYGRVQGDGDVVDGSQAAAGRAILWD